MQFMSEAEINTVRMQPIKHDHDYNIFFRSFDESDRNINMDESIDNNIEMSTTDITIDDNITTILAMDQSFGVLGFGEDKFFTKNGISCNYFDSSNTIGDVQSHSMYHDTNIDDDEEVKLRTNVWLFSIVSDNIAM